MPLIEFKPARVVEALRPKRLASRCKLVKIAQRESWVLGLLSSVTIPGLCRHLRRIASAFSRSHSRSGLRSGSPFVGRTNLPQTTLLTPPRLNVPITSK